MIGPKYWVKGKWIATLTEAYEYAGKIAAGEQTSAKPQATINIHVTDGEKPVAVVAQVVAA